MRGPVEDAFGAAALHDAPAVQHHDLVAQAGDHAQVVRDQDDGGAEVALQVAQQRDDLGLHRHVQGGGGLVGDQEVRLARRAIAIMIRWRMPPENSCG